MFEVHNEGYQWNKILYQLTNYNLVLEGTAIHIKFIKSKNHNKPLIDACQAEVSIHHML